MEKMKILLFTTIFFSFFSITIYEGLIIIWLIFLLIYILKERKFFKGYFTIPILMFSVPQVISTALNNLKFVHKSLEQGLFSFIYFSVPFFRLTYKDLERIHYLILVSGFISYCFLIYNLIEHKKLAVARGSVFEVALFSSIFAIVSFSLYIYKRNKVYLLLFILFSLFVFVPSKRSYMIGYILAIGLLLFLLRHLINKKVFYGIACFVIVVISFTFIYLSGKDIRFRYMYEVLIGKRDLNANVINAITTTRLRKFNKGVERIKKSWREGNYIAFIFGHGIEKAKPYLPPPYESIFILQEFIERGIIGLLGILLFFYRYFRLFFKFSIRKKEDILIIPFLIIPAVNIGATIFNVFWNAMLPLYIVFLGIVEYFYNKK